MAVEVWTGKLRFGEVKKVRQSRWCEDWLGQAGQETVWQSRWSVV